MSAHDDHYDYGEAMDEIDRLRQLLEPKIGTYACCVHCADDQPHIEADTRDLPCNAPNPCPQQPLAGRHARR